MLDAYTLGGTPMKAQSPMLTTALLLTFGTLSGQNADLAIVGGMLIDGNEGTPLQDASVP